MQIRFGECFRVSGGAFPRGRVLLGVLVLALVGMAPPAVQAQDVAYIDSEQILKQMPEYAAVQQQLDRLTEQWEQEIAAQETRVDTLEQEYRARELLYTDEQRQRQRQEIETARRKVQQLQKRYFGPEKGRLYRRQQKLMRPIQERVLAVVEEIAQAEGYDYVLDKSGPSLFMYANPEYDLTGDVLEEIGIDVDESNGQTPSSSSSSSSGGEDP